MNFSHILKFEINIFPGLLKVLLNGPQGNLPTEVIELPNGRMQVGFVPPYEGFNFFLTSMILMYFLYIYMISYFYILVLIVS